MPLVVELLENFSDQDLRDLDTLASETPQGARGTGEGVLNFCGRFNSRLLAIAVVQPLDGEWQLQRVAVRALTRRRGVGRRLLEVVEERARAQGLALGAVAPATEEQEFFLVSMGFRPCAEGRWRRR